MKIKIIFATSLLLISSICFYSCNKISKNEISESKDQILNINNEISITISNKLKIIRESKLENYIYQEFGKNVSYQYRNYLVNENDFNALCNFVNNKNLILGMILYTKSIDEMNFNNNNLKAISIYYKGLNENIKNHKLFENVNGKFVENTELSVSMANILTNHGEFIAFNFLKEDVNGITYIKRSGVGKINSIFDELKLKELVLEYKYIKKTGESPYYNYLIASVPPSGGNGGGGGGGGQTTCGAECTYGSNITHYCFEQNMCIPIEKPNDGDFGDCPKEQSVACLIDSTSISQTMLDTVFKTSNMYDFRDNFLINSNLGLFYTRSYYYLGAYINAYGLMNLNIASQIASIMPQIDGAMYKMQNPSIYGSSVVISSSLKTSLVNLLNTLKAQSVNTTFSTTCDLIKGDVVYFEGKTVNQILTDF